MNDVYVFILGSLHLMADWVHIRSEVAIGFFVMYFLLFSLFLFLFFLSSLFLSSSFLFFLILFHGRVTTFSVILPRPDAPVHWPHWKALSGSEKPRVVATITALPFKCVELSILFQQSRLFSAWILLDLLMFLWISTETSSASFPWSVCGIGLIFEHSLRLETGCCGVF